MKYYIIIKNIGRVIIDRLHYKKKLGTKLVGEGGGSWVLNADQLKKTKPILFSGGVGHDISFEIAFARNYGGKIFLYDPSETGKNTMNKMGSIHNLEFIQKALGREGQILLDPPANSDEGSWTLSTGLDSRHPKSVTFDSVSIVNEIKIKCKNATYIDVVKLDIEGSEYDVIEELLKSDICVGQILVEFHDFFSKEHALKTKKTKRLLNDAGFSCIYKKRYDHTYINTRI